MNIYVETNFVLELTFEQEQSSSCQHILQLCEKRQAALIIPAYSLAVDPELELVMFGVEGAIRTVNCFIIFSCYVSWRSFFLAHRAGNALAIH